MLDELANRSVICYNTRLLKVPCFGNISYTVNMQIHRVIGPGF